MTKLLLFSAAAVQKDTRIDERSSHMLNDVDENHARSFIPIPFCPSIYTNGREYLWKGRRPVFSFEHKANINRSISIHLKVKAFNPNIIERYNPTLDKSA